MERLKKEIRQSAYLHKPLPLHREGSLEEEIASKRVLERRALDQETWLAEGGCSLNAFTDADGAQVKRLETASPVGSRPIGNLEQGDCFNLGQVAVHLRLDHEDWRDFNRLYLRIRPFCEGLRKPHLGIQFHNEGAQRIPDIYGREGFHAVNLENGKWNSCWVELASLPRDCITGLSFRLSLNGCETAAELGNRLVFDFGPVELQKAESAEKDLGWAVEEGKIAWCFSGYEADLEKRAVIGTDGPAAFEIVDEKGDVVFSGTAEETACPHTALADFSEFTKPGTYMLRCGNARTDGFAIGSDIWLPSVWKALNFLFCQRCGYPVPGSHLSCHRDITASHGGRSFVFNGGWHDAGDLSQQLIQSAEVTHSLLEMYVCLRKRGDEGAFRFLEEALWGLDYMLKSRFGDGYRATSVGMSMWTQGFLGDRDDVHARVHDNAYENYLCAGVEAFAASCLAQEDPGFAERLLACAEADFGFAEAKFARTGFDELPPSFWEHSYMTPESAFSATAAWSAALLHGLTRKEEYALRASEAAGYAIGCMETGCVCEPFAEGGFFWRNAEKRVPVHFNHQARDHVFAQMLAALLENLSGHADARKWSKAAGRYAAYLKRLYGFSSPYGMLPSGIYHEREPEDKESFRRQHLLAGEEAVSGYAAQLQNGLSLGGGWHLKQFPVWFSFRGNNAVLLSQAKSAAILSRLTGDGRLKSIASAQLKWNVGLNPFRQSLMYGEGKRYASQYAVLPGEMTGELPVGVQTKGDTDEPCWPRMNNATYKEVWTTPAARWLAVVSELMRPE